MTETAWIPGDWATVKVGDAVKLEHDIGSIKGTIDAIAETPWVGRINVGETIFEKAAGWTLFIEAPPVPELPIEPGYYADRKNDVWNLATDGYWYDGSYSNGFPYLDVVVLKSLAPFTRLTPETETAKKVLDRIDQMRNKGEVWTDRKSGVSGKSVGLGGRRSMI